MQNKSAASEDTPHEVDVVPPPTVLSGPINVLKGSPDPQTFQNATRLLARLPQWRKGRRRLFRFGLWISPIPTFLLWHYFLGPDWWQGLTGLGLLWGVYIFAYAKLWDLLSGKSNRAISVVLKATIEPSAGPIVDACCQTPGFIYQGAEIKRTLIDRLGRVTSPNEDSLTVRQLAVLHDIVQGRLLPTSFDTASLCIILNALVHLGDSRSVACLEELVERGGKSRDNPVVRTMAQQYLRKCFAAMGASPPMAEREKIIGGGGKVRDNAAVLATAQQCLVHLQARLGAESLRASLLRSSEQTSRHDATLLRPATTGADATASEQLLRAHSEP